jgi:SAM-dependent methyltransferase
MASENQEEYWDRARSAGEGPPSLDPWISRYRAELDQIPEPSILDLGCGSGANVEALLSFGGTLIAADISDVALHCVQGVLGRLATSGHAPRPERSVTTTQFDMSRGFPFETGSFDIIVSDLSLHYFPWTVTTGIVAETACVLRAGDVLLCRVNSMDDTGFGAGAGTEIEPHFYERDGHFKRFFTAGDLRRLFAGWHILALASGATSKYGHPKRTFEALCRSGA